MAQLTPEKVMWICSHKCTLSHFKSEMMSVLGMDVHVFLAYDGGDKRSRSWPLLSPSQSVGILSRSLSVKCPHSSFSACFLELVPTPCPRTVAVTIVSLPGSNLALLQSHLQPLTLRRLLFAHNWPVASHDTRPRISTCRRWFWASTQIYVPVLSLIPTYQKWVKFCPTSGLGMNVAIL